MVLLQVGVHERQEVEESRRTGVCVGAPVEIAPPGGSVDDGFEGLRLRVPAEHLAAQSTEEVTHRRGAVIIAVRLRAVKVVQSGSEAFGEAFD